MKNTVLKHLCSTLPIKTIIVLIAFCLSFPCLDVLFNQLHKSPHWEAYREAHYAEDPQIFWNSLQNKSTETENVPNENK